METQLRTEPTLPIHFQLSEIWQRILGCPVESIAENFFELGGHSLLVARLLDEIEAETGYLIPISVFLNDPTVRGCTDALLAKPQPDNPIIQLQSGNGGVPLFFFHGDILGGGFYVRRLVPHFGPEQPLYVIAPAKLAEGTLPTIEQLAVQRADQIQAEVPRGPYALAGFCIGGVVAFETARHLISRGEEVQSLVLIDPEISSTSETWCLRAVNWLGDRRGLHLSERIEKFMVLQRKLARLRQVKNSPLKAKCRFMADALRKLRRNDRQPAMPDNGEPAPVEDKLPLLDAFQWMTTAYRPKPYGGRVRLIYTREQMEATPHLLEEWRKAVPHMRAHRVLGRHLTAITTYGSSIVAAIREEMRGVS